MTDSTPTPECPHGHDTRDDCMWAGGPCYDDAYKKQIAALTAERDRYRDALERIIEDRVSWQAMMVARASLTPIEEQHHD